MKVTIWPWNPSFSRFPLVQCTEWFLHKNVILYFFVIFCCCSYKMRTMYNVHPECWLITTELITKGKSATVKIEIRVLMF